MIYAFVCRARSGDGRILDGVLYAGSAAEAHYRLRHRLAREPLSIRLDPWHTLLQWLSPQLRVSDLVLFYRALGRRLERGQAIQPGLDHAQEFVEDPRLVQAVAFLAHGLKEGQSLGAALRSAGFPERDAAALDAVADSGRLPETLQVLATELERRERLRAALRRTLQTPLTVAVLLHAGLYFALTLFLPTMARFYAALGATQLPPLAQQLFALADTVQAHLMLATLIWLLLPLLFWHAARSRIARDLWERLPIVAALHERSELATLWSSFATLYDAGVQVEEACRLLRTAATRASARRWFQALGRELHGGWPLVQAVQRAGFPAHVVRSVRAADSGGDLVAGLRVLSEGLAEDVAALGARQEQFVRVLSTLVAAVLIALFFLLTYYPVLSSTFSQI